MSPAFGMLHASHFCRRQMAVLCTLAGAIAPLLAPLAAPLVAPLAAQPAPPHLNGVWGGVLAPPAVSGDIALQHSAGRWTLRASNATATAQAVGDTVRLVLHGTRGETLGELRLQQLATPPGQSAPLAFWIQPPGMGASYATPVRLTPSGAGQWRGTIHPLPERFALYLAMQQGAGDTVWATFRNPEGNFGGGRRLRVVPTSGQLVIYDSASGRQRFAQPWSASERSIAFDFGAPLVLREVTPHSTRDLAPRLPGEPTTYQTPRSLRDGWIVGHAVLRRSTLDSLIRVWSAFNPHGGRQPRLHAVLAAHNGTLVLDEYFRGWDANRLHDLRSASKTLTGILFGALMQQRPQHTVHDTVLPSGATVAHLLTHTSGLDCNDDDSESPGNEDRMQAQQEQPDWYRYAHALPQRYPPGTRYAYCSAGINLVGEHLVRSTGHWLPAFFETQLARPLGITHYAWNLMPTGQGYAGGGVYLSARDFLKFGQLWLNDGVWQGQRVVPSTYVAASVQRQQPDPSGATDGYAWHRHTLRVHGRAVESYEASGNGGQFLVVVPALRAVVVVLAEHYGEGARWLQLRNEVVMPVLEAITGA